MLTLSMKPLPAQVLTSMGTDFWMAIMPCWLDDDADRYYLSASGPRSCNITVQNPNTGWSHTFAIAAGGITTYLLPNAHSWQAGSCVVNNMGLHVTSTDSVQLWVDIISQSPSACDASHLLPTTALGSDYIVQTSDVSNSHPYESRAQFSVLAIEDSTTVDIVLSSPTSTDIPAGTTLTRTLHAGQVFQVQGPRQSGDFSGTSVRARNCKKIAVFSGASSTNMPFSNTTSADMTYQQNLPTTAFGTEWLLTPSAWHDNSDYVIITSLFDNCQIYRNGTLLTTIGSHQSFQFQLSSPSHIVTSQPVALYQYLDSRHSSGTGSDWGDVAMFAPNTIHQTTKSCIFPCYDVRNRSSYSSKYYINVVVPTAETSLLRFDYNSVTGFAPIPGTNYSYVRKSITNSAHILTTTGSGFSAYTYGLGENWEAYAMSLGGTDPSIQLPLNGEIVTDVDTGSCTGALWWRDTLLTAPSFTQWTTPSPVVGCDSIYNIRLTVYPSYFDTLDTALCGNTMLWGITPLDVPGSYTFNNLTLKGCDSLLHINLTQLDHFVNSIDSSACTGTMPWHDTLLTAPGYYTFTYTASNGCDSVVHLNLSNGYSYSDTLDTSSCHSVLLWGDTLLSVPGSHTLTYSDANGCDSLLHLNIILLDNPLTLIDTGACDEQFPWQDSLYDVPGEYDIIYAAANGCDSTLRLVLEQYPSHHRYETILLEEGEEHVGPDGQTYHPGDSYDIMLQTKHGCDSIIHVSLINSGCTPKIWAPNAFTPLQSSNNLFRVASSNVTEMTVSIYQRWGDWVCTFDGLTQGWDGTKNGKPCQENTYVYLIRYQTPCLLNPKPIVGTITIIH